MSSENVEFLKRFQNFLQRNISSIDWKIYILALSKYYCRRFDLKILGSLQGNRIYRNYVNEHKISYNQRIDINEVYEEIVNSLKYISSYIQNNEMDNIQDYFEKNKYVIPLSLNNVYSGAVSLYFYAAIPEDTFYRVFYDYPDDVFYDLFNCDKNAFLQLIEQKRKQIIKYTKILELMKKLEAKFTK